MFKASAIGDLKIANLSNSSTLGIEWKIYFKVNLSRSNDEFQITKKLPFVNLNFGKTGLQSVELYSGISFFKGNSNSSSPPKSSTEAKAERTILTTEHK